LSLSHQLERERIGMLSLSWNVLLSALKVYYVVAQLCFICHDVSKIGI
jgi:hypothetical protein